MHFYYLCQSVSRGPKEAKSTRYVLWFYVLLLNRVSHVFSHHPFAVSLPKDYYNRKGKELLRSSSLSTRKWNRSETMRMSQSVRDSASESSSTVDSDEGNGGASTKIGVPLGTPAKAEPSKQQSSKEILSPDFKHLYECQICSVEFRDNDAVYSSNNPRCNHHFHQKCMEKWLNYQYTCPICHEVFALQTF